MTTKKPKTLTDTQLDGVPMERIVESLRRRTRAFVLVRVHHGEPGTALTDRAGEWYEQLGILESARDVVFRHTRPVNQGSIQ